MAVKVGSARKDENSKYKNGKAGDQTGIEVSTQDWYIHSKGWIMLRARDPKVREKIAQNMEYACGNRMIGYDQNQNKTLYEVAKPLGFDCSKVNVACETDCARLVRVCILFAGVQVNDFYTGTMKDIIMSTGAFDLYTDSAHCKSSDKLMRGDILVTKTKGHTVVVLNDGVETEKEKNKAKDQAAIKVESKPGKGKLEIDGRWGKATTTLAQQIMKTTVDGKISNQNNANKKYCQNASTSSWQFKLLGYKNGSALIKAIQKLVGVNVITGQCDRDTIKKLQIFLNAKGFNCGTVDGYMGEKTVKAWQKYLNSKV